MEINSKLDPALSALDAEWIEADAGVGAAGGPRPPQGPAADAAAAGAGVELRDPLECRLAELVQGKDLANPQVFSSTSRLILQEILSSVFDDRYLNGLDRQELLDTFQGFIQADPSMKEVLEQFLRGLAEKS